MQIENFNNSITFPPLTIYNMPSLHRAEMAAKQSFFARERADEVVGLRNQQKSPERR